MLRWLKKLIRDWLSDEPDPYLECFVRSGKGSGPRLRKFYIVAAEGMRLRGHDVDDRNRVRLISDREAIDPDKFWQLWKRFAGDVELTWAEDGKPFDPA